MVYEILRKDQMEFYRKMSEWLISVVENFWKLLNKNIECA